VCIKDDKKTAFRLFFMKKWISQRITQTYNNFRFPNAAQTGRCADFCRDEKEKTGREDRRRAGKALRINQRYAVAFSPSTQPKPTILL